MQTNTVDGIRVTVDNFRRAETDNYFSRFADQGGFGKLVHERVLVSIHSQAVIRMNRDTLYSSGLFDLDAAPVTITLPDVGTRYMALQVINQDHYTIDVFYAPGSFTITKEVAGTQYVALLIRTFVDPGDPLDMEAVHALQDAIKVEQHAMGRFDVPNWDQSSLNAVRDALLALASASGGFDSARMFGRADEVDPVQHLLGTAGGWGGNPPTAALYSGVVPEQNDGQTVYRLTVKDVPVDGFWSVSVYNKAGYFEKNDKNIYSVNNVTATPNDDGSVTIQFGGDETSLNQIPVTTGWNYVFRLYRPRSELLDGTWKVPEPQIVNKTTF